MLENSGDEFAAVRTGTRSWTLKLAITNYKRTHFSSHFSVSGYALESIVLHTIDSHGVQGGFRRTIGHGYSP